MPAVSAYKNALYIKSPNPAWMDIAEDLQARYGFTPAIWISGTSSYHETCKARFPATHIMAHNDAMRALSFNKDFVSTQCVDADFLAVNSRYEDIFYNMMDRWFGDPHSLSIEKRRAYYIDMANFWISLIENAKIELIVVPTIPHRLYDYMGYIVAQYLGVPFIMMEITNELLVMEDGSRKSSYYLLNNLDRRSRIFAEVFDPKAMPSPELQRYLGTTLASYDAAQPLYFKSKNNQKLSQVERARRAFRKIPLTLRLPVHLFKFYLERGSLQSNRLMLPYRRKASEPKVQFQSALGSFKRHQKVISNVRAARDWYNVHAVMPDLKQKYIYFAASFQPERTSSPDSGLCQWTELMIEMIAHSIPPDWKIYFKEHPSNFREPIMSDNVRNVGFYERIRYLAPRVEFVSLAVDQFDLIDHAQCVAASTGTSVWQATTRGVPGMVFGEVWFAACSEVGWIGSINECRAFINRILGGFKPNREIVEKYLCAIEKVCGQFDWARGHKPYDPQQMKEVSSKERLSYLSDEVFRLYKDALASKQNPEKKVVSYGR
jgi:hypothetical protein